MSFKKHIPNAITCANLFCGCLAIAKIFEGDLVWAAYLVGIGAILDFMDGMAARVLKAYSPIGKDLDSLADMVTFGLVPGLIMFKILSMITSIFYTTDVYFGFEVSTKYLPYIAFIIPVFSAIRLAKFNNDTRQTDSFIGLPTPANAILLSSFPVIFGINQPFLSSAQVFGGAGIFFNPNNLVIFCIMLSFLLLSEIRLFSLKFRSFGWRENKVRYVFLFISALFLFMFHVAGIPAIIATYIIMSILMNFFTTSDTE
jgi:CDP-diacylglycerol---serine O-phosphatidyltransferase